VELISRFRILVAIFFVAVVTGSSRAAAQESTTVPPVADVLVSRQLAARAHLAVGDIVTLAGDPTGTRATQFRVAGIYEPTPDPLRFNVERLEVRLHLDDLAGIAADREDASSADTLSAVNVRLADPAGTAFSRALSARAPFVVATRPGGSESATFVVIDRFHRAIALVTVIGSTAFLLALMVIRAEERKETVGVLRLIGISRKTILAEVVVEGLVVAIAGAIFGVGFAALAQRGVNQFFQARYDTALIFMRITPAIAMRSILVALPVGVVAGTVASWLLLRRGTSALVRR
jgi:putative ABC transport system permease protein